MEKILISQKLNKDMEKQIAEFIGIMLGDGNLGRYKSKVNSKIKTQHRIRISLDSRNKNYIKYVINLIKEILKIEPKVHYKKNENVADIGVYRKDTFFWLRDKIGLKESPKWNNMEIPKKYFQERFYPFILKGLFDTDGSLTIFKNNGILYPRIEIKICPSPTQKQIIKILNNLRFNYRIQNLDKGKIRVRISGVKELQKWFKLIGSANIIHIEKANKFIKKKVL